MGIETALIAGAIVAGTASAGASAKAAHDQRKEAKAQRRDLRKQQEEEKAQALAARKEKIDALRESGVGMTTLGRRSLLSGSELGMTSQTNIDGIKQQLG